MDSEGYAHILEAIVKLISSYDVDRGVILWQLSVRYDGETINFAKKGQWSLGHPYHHVIYALTQSWTRAADNLRVGRKWPRPR